MRNLVLTLAGAAARILPTNVKMGLYRLPWLARFIRSGLNKAAPQGLLDVTVAAGPLAGMYMSLDMQSEKEFWLGTYESELQSVLMDLVKPGMVAYDVGANVGYFTLLLGKLVGPSGRVYAFEALPANVNRLKRNLALNGLEAYAEIESVAVVNCSRSVEFMLGPSGRMGKVEGIFGRHTVDYREKITLEGISLDEFVSVEDHLAPDVIKMDIEGGEVLALPGMQNILTRFKPMVFLELHGEEAAQVAWQLLTSHNYRIASITPGHPEIDSIEMLDWKAYILASHN